MPGQASLGGHVRDGNGQGIRGAIVQIAESDASITTDDTGAYQLSVAADSTVTLFAKASGMANTFSESVIVAQNATISDFDILMISADQASSINSLAVPGQEATRGVVAVRLHSTTPGCLIPGAKVTVFPPSAATVIYSSPAAAAGGLDLPDPALTAVQAASQTSVWLAAAVPPGNMNLLRIDVEQTGCQLMAQSPSLNGLVFPGRREVAAASLTDADLFLQ